MVKLSFRTQVLSGFAASILLVLAVGVLSYKSINQFKEDTAYVDHTQRVIKTSSTLLRLMIDAETGSRGYAATENPVFLDPYNRAAPQVSTNLNQLKDLISDNPIEVRRVDSLSTLIHDQLGITKTNIDTRTEKGLDYMLKNHMLLNGKQNMDQIRRLVDEISKTENDLLAERRKNSQESATTATVIIITGSIVFLVIVFVLFFYIQGTFDQQRRIEEEIRITNGQLEKVLGENEAKNWLLTGIGLLNDKMQGQQTEKQLSNNILSEVCAYTNAQSGTFYLYNEKENYLDLAASYAFHNPDAIKKRVTLNEGWLGQAATDKKSAIVKGRINDKLNLESSIITETLVESIIVPFFFDNQLKGVMEIAFDNELTDANRQFIEEIASDIAVAVNTAQARTIMHDLFEETQQQAEELSAQQEEMRVTNEELLNKTEMLQASEEELRVQQEELRAINSELEEKASLLEEKNQAIEEARNAIGVKVNELEASGRYKSEFLANMSHELRTPLNSILVLARILKDNKPKNLTEDQVKYSDVIFNAGNDLLTLINDILDLSKIESGKMDINNEDVKIADVLKDMEALFGEVAANKKIKFTTDIKKAPEAIFSDKNRLEQVLKNLLSNAFKFTPDEGAVEIAVVSGAMDKTVEFRIKDTGIGIAADKQRVIFEAFQQADGSTSRKYGGTGLGLSISRELATILGGEIRLSSEPGKGSEFVLTLPEHPAAAIPQQQGVPDIESFAPSQNLLKPASRLAKRTDREPTVVIVEDDRNFSGILQDYAKEHGYKAVMVHEGTNAVETIKETLPDAVILDIMLPGKDGWQILKELKNFAETANIPVHMMSAGDVNAKKAEREGAISFLKKPIDTNALSKLFGDIMVQSGTNFTQILLIEDHKSQSDALKELMINQGISVDQAFDGESALRMLNEKDYQCVILDLNLPDISGLDLLDKIKAVEKFTSLPIIINTAMQLDKTSVNRLMKYANAMVVKTNKSSDRLIDEVNLFLNKISETAGAASTGLVSRNTTAKSNMRGKKVLVVDDDMRNIFALSSALQTYDFVVETAGDGREAIDKLEEMPDVDIVLMDIMMPNMDGYEATRHIRQQNKWAKLPIIALTAKAMQDDREKCIAAGANDYITKPVDIDRLISLMQLWLEN